MSKQYSKIAPVYNHLMRSVDYKLWAEYIYSIYKLIGSPDGRVLELGAGTGKLSGFLSNKFTKFFITDLSKEMLTSAETIEVSSAVCNMMELPFNIEFGFIYSCFDSVNYILNEEELLFFFNSIADILDSSGGFTFDVSLENNSLRHQVGLNKKGRFGEIKYEQKSYYSQKEKIHYNKFIIKAQNEIYEEIHKQKIYKFMDYFAILENSKLYVENCFDAFSFENAKDNSERVQFILKKRLNYDNI